MVKLVAQTPLFFALFALGARLLRYATLTRPARRAKNTTSRIRGGMKIKERLSKHPLAAAVVSFFAFTVLIGLLLGAILGPLKCRDGWASPSIGQSGACSWHGGVDRNRGALNTLLSLAGAFGVFLWCVPINRPNGFHDKPAQARTPEMQARIDEYQQKIGQALVDNLNRGVTDETKNGEP
jgi:hypothetical protein